ncbi:transcription factor COE1 helix-loop-helix domain-containing protein [Ditylenchus destructor]|nr:transcription factor COE1 helix-loop-helix domain-containing protein [Ditylenchus destructor]
MFVHNNSKHGRRIKRGNDGEDEPNNRTATTPNSLLPAGALQPAPIIKTICPSEGWCQGGTTAIIIGENFHEGMQVNFGSATVWAEMITPQALKAIVPPRNTPGQVDVTFSSKGKPYSGRSLNSSFRFTYISLSEPNIDYGFQRLQKLLPKYPNDPDRLPKDVILRRAAELAEALYNRTPDQLSHYAYTQFESADYARNHASPRSLAASYSTAHAAAGLPIYQGMRHLQESTIGYHPSATPQAVATANFLNSPAGFSPFGGVNPFTASLQTLQKPGTY